MSAPPSLQAHRPGALCTRKARHRPLLCAASGLLVAFAAPAAKGQGSEVDETERWVPAFGALVGVMGWDADGSLVNSLRPPDDPGTPSFGDGVLLYPSVGGTIELSTPALPGIPGRPRLFAHGDVAAVFGSDLDLAREGSPGPFEIPPIVPDSDVPANSVGGQGAAVEAELYSPVVSAGAGIAFTFDVGERRLRLKPSVDYIQQRVHASGIVNNVEGNRITDSTGQIVQDFTFTTLTDGQTKTFHGIGGGLELETDVMRAGSFVMTLSAGVQAYSVLGDRGIELAASDGTNTAAWSVEMAPWILRGGAGIRFRFSPKW